VTLDAERSLVGTNYRHNTSNNSNDVFSRGTRRQGDGGNNDRYNDNNLSAIISVCNRHGVGGNGTVAGTSGRTDAGRFRIVGAD